MNHLAHAHLAAHGSTAYRAGSVLGDFVKGPLHEGRFPAELQAGLQLHRRVDGFTDRHPLLHDCRERFPRDWRRLAGPALDVFWDHFLSLQWPNWHADTLADFSTDTGLALHAHADQLSATARRFSHWLAKDRILETYDTLDGVAEALDLMRHRLPASAGLAQAGRRFLAQEHAWLESRFRLLYAETLDWIQQNPA